MSRFFGSHTIKLGAEYRVIGMKLTAFGQPSGNFDFTPAFTRGPNPLTGGTTAHALASFLLGFPANGDITVGAPNDFYIRYFGGYVQDDYRVTRNLTANLGLRYEFEQGLQERDNRLTVGFDRSAAFPVQIPGALRPDGTPLELKGGLMYGGVDGNPTHQSDPSKKKFAPRIGFAYSLNPRTVVRGGYGLFYAPNQYAFPDENRLGTRGFTAVTTYFASNDGGLTPCAGCSLTNPSRTGSSSRVGSALGLRTGVGGTVHFVDQFRESAYVHQFSVDVQRELRSDMSLSVGYLGSRSEKLSVGGTNSNTVNINQLEPRILVARDGPCRTGAEPVLRKRGLRRVQSPGDDCPRSAPASLSSIWRCPRAPDERRKGSLPRDGPQVRPNGFRPGGARTSTTPTASTRTICSARSTTSAATATRVRGRSTRTTWTPNTRTPCSTRRTG